MKILMINKFLYPNGGSETYIFKLGEQLQAQGHRVEYFGMEHEGRIVGNRVGVYTGNMDFHKGSMLGKLTYPIKTIYSAEARKKLRLVLDDFMPDVCHINNFNYQLTPSIILEIRAWEKQRGQKCKIVYTAHDYQLVCPNHMCLNPGTHQTCEKCLGAHFLNCVKGKCIHSSGVRSVIGAAEAIFWKQMGVYRQFDAVICCSQFMKEKLDTNPDLRDKTITLHNFVDEIAWQEPHKDDYVLYFGRFSQEKGIDTLVAAAKSLPDIPFIFAGSGPLENLVGGEANIRNVGFKKGAELEQLIRRARFTVYPSEWYENCPFSVMESQMYATPVLGADIGGIPELIRVGETGELFESGNAEQLKAKLRALWDDREKLERYAANCRNIEFDSIKTYSEKLIKIYCQP